MRDGCDGLEMSYYDEAEDVVPDLLHFGVAHFRHARGPLAQHSHRDAIEIFYVESGMVRYVTSSGEYEVHGGQVFIFFPDEVHGTGSFPEERTSFAWLSLRLYGGGRSFLGGSGKAYLVLRESLRGIDKRVFSGRPELMATLKRAVDAVQKGLDYAPCVVLASVVDFVSMALDDLKRLDGAVVSPKIAQARQMIDANAGRRLTLEEVSKEVGVPVPTLKRRFKVEIGMPPYEYFLRRKVEMAAGLLRSTCLDMGAIAYRLGFSSSQHLSFAFRRLLGVSPSAYRAKAKATLAKT